MKKTGVTFVCLLLLVSIPFSAQTYKGKGRITGFVFDQDGNPIEGVTVKLFSLRASAGFEIKSEKDGKWTGAWLRGGGWDLDFEKFGYEPKKISVAIQEMGKRMPPIEIRMNKIEGVVVSDDLKADLTKGNDFFNAGQYQEAIGIYSEMLVKHPDIYILNTNIGNCYFEMEDYAQAMTFYQIILEQDPDNSAAMISIGNCMANQGDNEAALEWYNKVEFDSIKDSIVLYNVGTDLYNSGNYSEALRYYQRSVEIQPDNLDGIYQLGLCYLTMGNKDESIKNFEKYLEIDSDSDRANQVRGFLDYLRR
ncbi:MAG: tetratricopeptide repeat protein [Candidatus Aminicenantaceae bacterium]